MSNRIVRPTLPAIELKKLGRLYRKRVSAEELPHYDQFLAHVGRGDMVRASDFAEARLEQLMQLETNPTSFGRLRQAYSLVEKLTLRGDSQAEQRAWLKYGTVERKCGRTNKKLRWFTSHLDRAPKLFDELTLFDVSRMKVIISSIFGDFEDGYARILGSGLGYGKGMSLSSADASKTSAPFKLSDPHTITADAVPVWRDFLNAGYLGLPGYATMERAGSGLKFRERVEIVPGCKIAFVDKTSVTKRTIAIEPSCNVSMQLAIHRYLVDRLFHKTEIDLRDGQLLNREMALEGSLVGNFGTIDLSAASDSVSYELVRMLLPRPWFELLDALRCPVAYYKGERIQLEKFSSSGNGFTFALETIIFYAIARVACDRNARSYQMTVYGDDIIVPTCAYSTTTAILRDLGFKVNPKKSFSEGWFRESCGLDAFMGVDVRPTFVRTLDVSLLELYSLHNQFFRKGWLDVCEYLVSIIPDTHRLYGPPGPHEGVLFTREDDVLCGFRRRNRALQTYDYKAFREKGRRARNVSRFWLLEAALYNSGVYSNGAPLRSQTTLSIYVIHT